MATNTAASTLLRLTTAGSVDDGKSTLIGRLLYEAKALFDDQLTAIEKQKRDDGVLDLSLVTDGLKSEREQGITIDVAYKYFSSAHRKFILADAPGHVQYTRNMVTAASLADAALILVDARHGIVEQTRRHAFLIHLLGVRHVVLAINKIDLIDYDETRIKEIEADFRALSWNKGKQSLHVLPLSALHGDNVGQQSSRTAWYQGPSLIELLDRLPSTSENTQADRFLLPIQLIIRASASTKRLAAGTVQRGKIRIGDAIQILPSFQKSRVASIFREGKEVAEAEAGQAIALGLTDERDLERGFQILSPDEQWQAGQDISADLVWFDDEPFIKDRLYLLRAGVQSTRAKIESIDYRFDLQSLEKQASYGLVSNDIVRARLQLARPSYLKAFPEDRYAGAFILIDPHSNRTVAAGMVQSLNLGKSQEKSKARLLFVDKLSERSHYSLGKIVQLPSEFLNTNSLANSKRIIETLYEAGWEIHVEHGGNSLDLQKELEAQGFGTYQDGAGI